VQDYLESDRVMFADVCRSDAVRRLGIVLTLC